MSSRIHSPTSASTHDGGGGTSATSSNDGGRIITLREACAGLSNCDTQGTAIKWLKMVHHALLHDAVNSYDPVSIFHILEATTTRFHPSNYRLLANSGNANDVVASASASASSYDATSRLDHDHQDTNLDDRRDDDDGVATDDDQHTLNYWSISEEALWACAALACICVGPSWRYNIHIRQRWLVARGRAASASSSSEHGIPNQISIELDEPYRAADTSRINKASVSVNAVTSAQDASTVASLPRVYPRIPESFPSRMLDFGASFISLFDGKETSHYTAIRSREVDNQERLDIAQTRKSFAVAQRYLVLGLCCESPASMTPTSQDDSPPPTWQRTTEWTVTGSQLPVGMMLSFWLKVVEQDQEAGWRFAFDVSRASVDLISIGWHPIRDLGDRIVRSLLFIAREGTSLLSRMIELGASHRVPADVLAASAASAEAISALASLASHNLIPPSLHKTTVQDILPMHVIMGAIKATVDDEISVLSSSIASAPSATEMERAVFWNQIESCFADTADFLWVLFATSQSAENTMNTLHSKVESVSTYLENWNVAENNWDSENRLACMTAGTAIRMIGAVQWGRLPDVVEIPHLRPFWIRSQTMITRFATVVHSRISDCLSTEEEASSASQSDEPFCEVLLSLAVDVLLVLGNFADRELMGYDDKGVASMIDWTGFIKAFIEIVGPWLEYSNRSLDSEEGTELLDQGLMEVESLVMRVCAILDKSIQVEDYPLLSTIPYEYQVRLYEFLIQRAVFCMEDMHTDLLGISCFRAWIKFGFFPFRLQGWVGTATSILSHAFSVTPQQDFVFSSKVRLETLWMLTHGDLDQSNISGSRSGTSNPSDGSYKSPFSLLHLVRHDFETKVQLIETRLLPLISWILNLRDARPHFIDVNNFAIPIKADYHYDNLSASKYRNEPESGLKLEKYTIRLVGKLIRDPSTSVQIRRKALTILESIALTVTAEARYEREEESEYVLDDLACFGSMRISATREIGSSFAAAFTDTPVMQKLIPHLLELLCKIVATIEMGVTGEPFQQENTVLCLNALLPISRLRLADGNHLSLLSHHEAVCQVPASLRCFISKGNPRSAAAVVPIIAPSVFIAATNGLDTDHRSSDTTISFDSLVRTLKRALHYSTVESQGDDTFPLIPAIIDFCCASICSYIRSGIDVAMLGQIKTDTVGRILACSGAALSASPVELLSTKILADYIDRNRNGLDRSLVEPLLQAMESTHGWQCIYACRGLTSILLQTEIPQDDLLYFFQSAKTTIAAILGPSHFSAGNIEEGATNAEDKIVALLSFVYEILIKQPFCASPVDLLEMMDCCNQIVVLHIQQPSYSVHLSIRCIQAMANMMDVETIALARVSKSELNLPRRDRDQIQQNIPAIPDFYAPRADFLKCLPADLLQERLDIISEKKNQQVKPTLQSFHTKLATELGNIEDFVAQSASKTEIGIYEATWLCGNATLLSCRVGGFDSHCRGWIEMILRSPTTRQRQLVRLSHKISLKEPQPVSPLIPTPCPPQQDPTPPSIDLPKSLTMHESTDILANAKALMAKFDRMVPEDVDMFTTSQIPGSVGHPQILQSNPMGKVQTHLDDKPRYARTIYQWLETVLGPQESDHIDVVEALVKLGFSVELQSVIAPAMKRADLKSKDAAFRQRYPMKRLMPSPKLNRAISILDRTLPCLTHKIALLYAASRRLGTKNDDIETLLLSCNHASPAFQSFANGLGKLVPTRELRYYSGGLDVSTYQSDGELTRAWLSSEYDPFVIHSSRSVIVYHEVSLMPHIDELNNRKRHVGNDAVIIVFVEKDSPIAADIDLQPMEINETLVSGHFGFVAIFVSVLPTNFLRVCVRIRNHLPETLRRELLPFTGNELVLCDKAAEVVRSIAMRADLACRSVLDNLPPPFPCLERYRTIRELKRLIVTDK